MKKLAVFFPGIGYTADRPLLYYSRRTAAELGYEIRSVAYSGFPADDHGRGQTVYGRMSGAFGSPTFI